jgi:NAD+ synthase
LRGDLRLNIKGTKDKTEVGASLALKLTKRLLDLSESESLEDRIVSFIRDYVIKVEASGIVLGVSGGVDSATTAALSSIAIGGEKVLGLYMPESETYNNVDCEHIELLREKFQFRLKTIDLTRVLESVYRTIPDYDSQDIMSKGNLKARARMLITYYYANHGNLIVGGSSDKSETMIGYYTKWGDAAADIAPIMDLYKTQVRQLALKLGIPEVIANKTSTPALWPGQKAEKEIGLEYETLDLILYGLEHFMHPKTIADQLQIPAHTVKGIKNRWLRTEHKRRMPLTTKLEYRTVGSDFRIPRTTHGGS